MDKENGNYYIIFGQRLGLEVVKTAGWRLLQFKLQGLGVLRTQKPQGSLHERLTYWAVKTCQVSFCLEIRMLRFEKLFLMLQFHERTAQIAHAIYL